MATFFNPFLFLSVIFWWKITYLDSICLDNFECDLNTVSCQNCSYNITLKEASNVHRQLSVCCDKLKKSLTWPQDFENRTLLDVYVWNNSTCNASTLYFDLPMLDTYSIHIKNTSLKQIRVNVKIRNLRQIDLSSNKLQNINKGLFNNFVNLRKLVLNKNNIASIFEQSFNGLTKLELLDLSENNLTILSNVFTPLKNLQHLNLSQNNIEFIHENYFNNWLLQHLDVSHNNLRKLAPGALQLLPNLARLLLTDNPHLGITQLDKQLLVGTGRRLQQIDASRTGLYQVPEAFTHSVRFLSLIGNKISAIRCGDFDSYPLLQSLDFSDNKIALVEEDSLGRLEMLLFLNMNKNFLTTVPKSLSDELKYLSMNNNLIKNLSAPDFKNLPNLRILMLQNNNINYIQNHVFDNLLSLEMLDLSNNPIKFLSWSTFDGPLSLRDLRLCYLNISVPEQDGSFPISSPESVQMLHLQSSPGLARQLLADSAALAAFSHLQYLDLRMNNLSEIRNDLLFYLVQLKTIRLHGNNINCSTELWLKDWISWNKNTSNSETCYYSTSEANSEITNYNCTFPETFTISDRLPPVNLYSTEMINKLLRYYGYLNNKTERPFHKHDYEKFKHNIKNDTSLHLNETTIRDFVSSTISSDGIKKNFRNMGRNDSTISLNINETVNIKTREFSKILNQNKIQNDQFNADHNFLDIEPHARVTLQTHSKNVKDILRNRQSKSISGKRLNTPLNITNDNENTTMDYNLEIFSSKSMSALGNVTSERHSTKGNYKTEYSPYRSSHSNYAPFIGTVAVCSLILMSLIIWISFRLRYKRRSLPIVDTETENQIEVSNISGGVLW